MGLAGQNNSMSLHRVVSGRGRGGGGVRRRIAFVFKMTAGDSCIVHP